MEKALGEAKEQQAMEQLKNALFQFETLADQTCILSLTWQFPDFSWLNIQTCPTPFRPDGHFYRIAMTALDIPPTKSKHRTWAPLPRWDLGKEYLPSTPPSHDVPCPRGVPQKSAVESCDIRNS